MVALKWSMKNIYDVKPGEVYWAASDIGWVVGHSYIVYAPLLNGSATVSTKESRWGHRTPERSGASSPSTRSRLCSPRRPRSAPSGGRSAGEFHLEIRPLEPCARCSSPESAPTRTPSMWAEEHLGVPVIDHWWQTETGWAIAANPVGLGQLPVKRGSATVAMPGYDVQVLDDAGHPVESGKLGNIVVKLPLPPSCLPTLWHADERFARELSR